MALNPDMPTFADLAIGDTFDFVSGHMDSFFGACKKTDSHHYTDGRFVYRIGSVLARVYHVGRDYDGQPVKTV